MSFAQRLILSAIILAVLTIFSQPVFSQDNPDLQRGIAEFRQENYEEALDGLMKARSTEPGSSEAAYYLGVTYKNLQDYEEAVKHLKEAVNLVPEIKAVHLELADVLYNLGKYEEAMDAVKTAESKNVRPGQTAFLKGLILLKMDENTSAIESFNKARAQSPGLVQAADYQIGLAMIKEDRLNEAETQFNEVIVKDPNTDMAAFATHFIDKIKKKRRERSPYHYYIGAHFQYDDNVVLRPSDESSAANVTDDDDYREVLTLGFEYVPRERKTFDVTAHYSFYLSNHHDLSNYDVMSHTAVLVPSYKINEKSSADVALSYNYTLVDGDKYLGAATISPTYTRSFGSDHTLQTYISYQKKEFYNEIPTKHEDRDSDQYAFNLNWYYFFNQDTGILTPFMERFQMSFFQKNKGYLNIFYKLYFEDAEGGNWEYVGNKADATVLLQLMERLKLSLSAGFEYQDFKKIHTDFDKVERRDLIYRGSALLFYRFYKQANVQLLYVHTRDDSNIPLYDYYRNIYSIGVEWRY
ncbi:MAG: tetratricopeptide repeat protein [Nitrospirota bacterium]